MTLTDPNLRSRFPATIEPILGHPKQKLILVDVGAAARLDVIWRAFEKICTHIGFEPDALECERMQRLVSEEASDLQALFYPYFLSNGNETRLFYNTKLPASSGFYKGNKEWLDRFPFDTLEIESEKWVDTITLDHFMNKENLSRVDFLKIDTEGAELDVLSGAQGGIKKGNILGIKTEFWWDTDIKDQASFSEIDIFLRTNGFKFFDLQLAYYPRSVLPAGIVNAKKSAKGYKVNLTAQNFQYGQAWTGDALYFRDPVGEHRNGRLGDHWNKHSLLRLCAILDAYNYGDCAIEILEEFRSIFFTDIDVDILMDSLTPEIDGQILNFREYLEISNQIRKDQNNRKYGMPNWEPPKIKYREEN